MNAPFPEKINTDSAFVIELVEDYLQEQNWPSMRPSPYEIYVETTATYGQRKLFFAWEEASQSLQICVELDVTISALRRHSLSAVLAAINTHIWLGHFDLTEDNDVLTPCFRYTSLCRSMPSEGIIALIDDVVQFAMHECDRVYHAFSLLSQDMVQSPSHADCSLLSPTQIANDNEGCGDLLDRTEEHTQTSLFKNYSGSPESDETIDPAQLMLAIQHPAGHC